MVRLNIGCGPKHYKEYTNVDVRTTEMADVICDVRNLKSIYPDNSVDEIFAKDVIEHLGIKESYVPSAGTMWWEWKIALKDWVDILKPGGVLKIQTPDIIKLAQNYIHAEHTRINFENWFILDTFGTQNYPENTHRCGFTKVHLIENLKEMGMRIAEFWYEQVTEMKVTAVKGDAEPLVSLAHPDGTSKYGLYKYE